MTFKYLLAVISILLFATNGSAQEPTHKDLRYSDEFKRSTMDLWLPESKKPAALIIYFHGGGFRRGDKSSIWFKDDFTSLAENGVAFASVGYPFIRDIHKSGNSSQDDAFAIADHTVKAVEFLKKNAEKYNLDTTRFAVCGSSAGAMISEYLSYPKDLGISACIAIQQPYGADEMAKFIKKNGAPLLLYTISDTKDHIHHPSYAKYLKKHCDNNDIVCHLYGSKASGLPQIPADKNFVRFALSILQRHWSSEKLQNKK